MHPGSNQPSEVGHVDPQESSHFVRNRAEGGKVCVTGVRRPPGDEDFGLVLERSVTNPVHINQERVGVNAIGGGVVDLAREVELHTVG